MLFLLNKLVLAPISCAAQADSLPGGTSGFKLIPTYRKNVLSPWNQEINRRDW